MDVRQSSLLVAESLQCDRVELISTLHGYHNAISVYNIPMFSFFIDTNQRLDMSVDSLSNMRQECESLREELRVLSEKLLKQHDAALESQVLRFFHSLDVTGETDVTS